MAKFEKGNQVAKGNKGGGRQSAYQEQADAQLLYDMFFGKLTEEEIKKLTSGGKYSMKDKFVEMALGGNERIMLEVFKKLFPDKFEGELKKPINIIITRGEDVKRGNNKNIDEGENDIGGSDKEEPRPLQGSGGALAQESVK